MKQTYGYNYSWRQLGEVESGLAVRVTDAMQDALRDILREAKSP